MNYQPHLIGVSDFVAHAIADRLLDEVRATDKRVENQALDPNLVGSMRNPKSQERSHARVVRSFRPLVVDHQLVTGHRFKSLIVNISDGSGWVFGPSHRGVGIRIDVIGCEGRRQPFKGYMTKAAVIDRHVLPRMIQHAGLTDYAALLSLIKSWSKAAIDYGEEFLAIAEWLHEERRRVMVPIELRGQTCAVLTGSEKGIGIKHPVLRGITLFNNSMLTDHERQVFKQLEGKPIEKRFEMIKSLPQRNGHLIG